MKNYKTPLLFMVALLFCAFACVSVKAEYETETFSYYVDDEGAHVTSYNGTDVYVIVPDILGGKPVVSVSLNNIPDRLSVARITLPDSVVRLDDYAFYGFQHVQGIDGLENIQYIGKYAFAFCSIQSLEFTDQLIHIGSYAFQNSALTHLTIPDDITYDDAAFNCWALEKITLTRGSNTQTLALQEEVLFSVDFARLIAYPVKYPRGSYRIPDGVKTVDWSTFDCAGSPLSELEVPASVVGDPPTSIDILGKLIMRVYEGTAGHEMARYLASMYDTNGFEYVLLNDGDTGESLSDYVSGVIAETTNSSMTDYQKALALHDWLVEHAEYDLTFTHTTAHDIFRYGLGICCSYADAYSWLLNESGILCKVVGNYDHALVAARLDGIWTYIDPTHNDGYDDKPYFGMNDEMFKYRYGALYPDHYNDMIITAEKLDISSVKCHYWYRNGFHDNSYAYLKDEIEKHIQRGETRFLVDADYYDPMTVLLCAGLITEDGLTVNNQHYKMICTRHETGNWFIYVDDNSETTNDQFDFDIKNSGIRITKYVGTETKVMIPDTIAGLPVLYIGDSAFRMNYLLEEVVFPDGLIEIEGNAFYNCMSLKKINIPSGLQCIGQEAFDSCYKLESDIILPDGFVNLEPQAFEHCKSITRVRIPGSASVGDCAFAQCTLLSDVTIEEGFRYLSNAVFSECSALTSIVLPESLLLIGTNAFYRTGLQSIHIPKSVSLIGAAPFQECSLLTIASLDQNNPNFIMRSGVIYSADEKQLIVAFPAIMDEHFVVPDSVESIQHRAVFGNNRLKSVYIPSNVKWIEQEAFSDCMNLSYIYMEDGCTSLGYCCFGIQGGGGCETVVRLASTVSEMDYGVLCGRPLISFVMPFENHVMPSWMSGTPSTLYFHRNVQQCGIIPNGSDLVVYGYPDSIVEQWALENEASFIPYTIAELPSVILTPNERCMLEELPEHYTMRWYSADPSVATVSDDGIVTATDSGRTIVEGEVETKSGKIEVFRCEVLVSSQETLALPEKLTFIGGHAFEGCAMTDIEIPENVNEIPAGVFANCPELVTVYIPESVVSILEDAFFGNPKSITIVAPEDSRAHQFAVEHGFSVVLK